MRARYKILVLGALALLVLLIVIPAAYLVYSSPAVGGSVAVIPVKGFMTLGECGGGLLGGGGCAQVPRIIRQLEDADSDWRVKAIVLEVDSGGGAVVASRELMRAVRDTKKPVVAWIGEVGASGAYYAASAADYVVADRDSVTGSIGVISSFVHYNKLMEKIGVNVTVIKAGESKDIGSAFREMTDEERQELTGMVDEIYGDFVRDIAINRGLSFEYALNISAGKLYLGREALKLGLIDDVGGFKYAVNTAGELGGIEGEPKLKYPEAEKGIGIFIDRAGASMGYGLGKALI